MQHAPPPTRRRTIPPGERALIDRAEALARGPHPCPGCEHPVWADPPVPWTGLRDYLVRCECCMRPVQVRIDRDALHPRLRAATHLDGRVAVGRTVATHGDDLLTRAGQSGFRRRLLAAAVLVALVFVAAVLAGAAPLLAGLLAMAAILPAAGYGPAIAARLLDAAARVGPFAARRTAGASAPVTVHSARWDQWLREVRVRRAERDPEALLAELARHVDADELARVEELVGSGVVPASHLDDLVRFRRSFAGRHGLAMGPPRVPRRTGAA